mgnify:CR=1 FL=1
MAENPYFCPGCSKAWAAHATGACPQPKQRKAKPIPHAPRPISRPWACQTALHVSLAASPAVAGRKLRAGG